ncbi:transposase [Streptomyces sp. NPDC059862]|uniref:transposase n=1 Tax=Streptomyces sp. NPDC059862 TaxID=3346975 RepID=UPI0036566A57
MRLAFDEAFDAVLTTHARRGRLDKAIEELAATDPFAAVVGRLRCLRGVSTLTVLGLSVEVGDWQQFTGSTIGSYFGLVPSEDSSGSRRMQGPITKTGNSHARRLLVEAAWHHRRPYRPSRELIRRRDGQPPAVRNRAACGNRRLNHRWDRLDAQGKRPTITAVAVARELAGWCWSQCGGGAPPHARPVGDRRGPAEDQRSRHPAEESGADPDEDLVRQALAAVTVRVEALEAEADQLRQHLQRDEEIRAQGCRAVAQAETERLTALRREALLDAVAHAEARAEIG